MSEQLRYDEPLISVLNIMPPLRFKNTWLSLGLLACLVNIGHAAEPKVVSVEQFSLSQYEGRVVYLDFWASWCGPCRQSFPFMQTLQDRYQDQGLSVVAINVDAESDDAIAFLQDYPANFDIVLDSGGTLAEQYQIIGMPSSFIIGPDGKVVANHVGFQDKHKQTIEQHIVRALEDSKP